MKNIYRILLMVVLLYGLCSCASYTDPVIGSLPDYKEMDFYTSGGFQDYTDYAKYTYESIELQELVKTNYFKQATKDDIEEILLHIENFEKWVKASGGDLEENYDFDKSIVSEGDYFYIKTKYGQPIGNTTYGKFANYTVYYFDVDAKILYYFHSNI